MEDIGNYLQMMIQKDDGESYYPVNDEIGVLVVNKLLYCSYYGNKINH